MKFHNNLDSATDGLPSHWYYDEGIFQQELQTLWANQWLYVCFANALAEPLSYQVFKIGKQNILVLRDKNNQLRAYHNSCRHRGSVLCTEAKGKLRNNNLLCPYHNWLFSAETGELKRTPTPLPKDFDKSAYGLYPVQIKNYQGLVFINLDTSATWSDELVFQSYDPILEKYPLEDMQVGHSWRTEVKCNWKLYWENFSECYHCPNVHPELTDLVPVFSRRLMDVQDVENWQQHYDENDPKYSGGLKQGAETWSANGSAQGRAISGTEELHGQSYSTTWPTMFLGAYADHLRTVRLLPIDAETTELSVEWLFERETLTDPEYKMDNVTEFAKLVMKQDAVASEYNQQGVYNPPFTQTVLMPEEYTIKGFHDWLRQFISQ